MSFSRVNGGPVESSAYCLHGRRGDAVHILNRHLGDKNPQVMTQQRTIENNQKDCRVLKRCQRDRPAHSTLRHLRRRNPSCGGRNSLTNGMGVLEPALLLGEAGGFCHHPVDSRHRHVILSSWTDCHSIFAGCEGFCSAGGGRTKKRKT